LKNKLENKPWELNLVETRKAALLGDVGEAIALYYLSSHGFYVVTRPILFHQGKMKLISAHHQVRPPKGDYTRSLNDEQIKYLKEGYAWDYVAFRGGSLCLVEVKTVRGHRASIRRPDPSQAKALGFSPILLIVRLLENWQVTVEMIEL
jgi:hypothetical protein